MSSSFLNILLTVRQEHLKQDDGLKIRLINFWVKFQLSSHFVSFEAPDEWLISTTTSEINYETDNAKVTFVWINPLQIELLLDIF